MKELMTQPFDFQLPRRQVNLDFHTSGSIEQIGAEFSKEERNVSRWLVEEG